MQISGFSIEFMLVTGLILIAAALGLLVYIIVIITRIGVAGYREQYIRQTSSELDDMYSKFRAEQYLYLSAVCAVTGLIVLLILSGSILMACFGGAAGALGPQVLLRMQKNRRNRLFGAQVVDTFLMLANLMKAGSSIRGAIKVVADDMPVPTSEEYGLVHRQISLGTPLLDAFANLCGRFDLQDMHIAHNALAIASKTGGDLAEVFENMAKTVRDRREIQDKIDSYTAQGKMQGWLVGLLPFFLLILLNFLHPDLVRPLFTSAIGICLLLLVVVMEILGVYFIRKVVAIDI